MRVICWALVPICWLAWVRFFLLQQPGPLLHGLDTFAGDKQMARSFLAAGMPMATFELLDDPVQENCLSMHGQQYFLQRLVQVSFQEGGICWMGPPCSWWVWLSRSVHQRSHESPQGNTQHPTVAFHNSLAEFVANAIRTCAALGVFFVLEQPLSSVMPHFAAVRAALAEVGAKRVSIPLWKFGAQSEKFLQLWGTAPWLQQLTEIARRIGETAHCGAQPGGAHYSTQPGMVHVPKPPETLVRRGGEGQVTGRPEVLSRSASYPACFCDVVAFLHKSYLHRQAAMVVAQAVGRQGRTQQWQWFLDALLPFLC